jgi:hypothetical protein
MLGLVRCQMSLNCRQTSSKEETRLDPEEKRMNGSYLAVLATSAFGRLLTDDNELVKGSILIGQVRWDSVVRSGQFWRSG